MIPAYLKGKSAAQILDDAKRRIITSSDEGTIDERYMAFADRMLVIAITHALCNADDALVESCDPHNKHMIKAQEAEGRAIAFLNAILPKERA